MGPHLYVGLPGLATDTQTVFQRLKFRLNLYELKEGRKMAPKTFSHMMSNLLYERRFGPYFVEPVVAGLDPKTGDPFVCNMDLIGEYVMHILFCLIINLMSLIFFLYDYNF